MPPLLPTSSHFTRCCQTWKAIIERLAKFGLEMTGSNPNNRTKMNCVGQTWSNMGFPWKHKVGPSHFLNHPVVFVAYPVYIQCLWPNPEFEIIWVLSFRSVVESLPTPWLPSIVLKFFELISIGGSPWLSLVSHGFTTLEAIHGVGSVIWKWRHPHANWSPAISLSLSFPFRCFPGSRYWRLDLLQTQCLHGSLMFSGGVITLSLSLIWSRGPWQQTRTCQIHGKAAGWPGPRSATELKSSSPRNPRKVRKYSVASRVLLLPHCTSASPPRKSYPPTRELVCGGGHVTSKGTVMDRDSESRHLVAETAALGDLDNFQKRYDGDEQPLKNKEYTAWYGGCSKPKPFHALLYPSCARPCAFLRLSRF